jgi:hypothetical protein
MGGRYSLLNLKSKGQRSSALDIKVKVRFTGSIPLTLPPRVTISHIWTTHGKKMFPIEFRVQRSSTLDIEVKTLFPGSRALCFPLRKTILHIWTTYERKMFLFEFWVKRSMVKCKKKTAQTWNN